MEPNFISCRSISDTISKYDVDSSSRGSRNSDSCTTLLTGHRRLPFSVKLIVTRRNPTNIVADVGPGGCGEDFDEFGSLISCELERCEELEEDELDEADLRCRGWGSSGFATRLMVTSWFFSLNLAVSAALVSELDSKRQKAMPLDSKELSRSRYSSLSSLVSWVYPKRRRPAASSSSQMLLGRFVSLNWWLR